MLQIAHASGDPSQLAMGPVPLAELLLQAHEQVGHRYPTCRIDIEFGEGTDTDAFTVVGNEPLLLSAVLNVLDNACKFSGGRARNAAQRGGFRQPRPAQAPHAPNRELLAQGAGNLVYRRQWQLGWAQLGSFIITILPVLFTDLLKGVSIGLVLGFFFLKDDTKAGSYLRRDPSDAAADANALLHLRLPEHVSFLNKASIVTTLEQLPSGSRVLLDGTRFDVIDHDVLEALEAFRQAAPARGIDLELRGITRVAVGAH